MKAVFALIGCMGMLGSYSCAQQTTYIAPAYFTSQDVASEHTRGAEQAVSANQFLSARYYDVEIPSFDGKHLQATLYQPALAPLQTAPLIIHSHSFGMFRMSSPASLYGEVIVTGQTALDAWRNGYWVLSYDQRGHGDSQGSVRVLDPAYEIRDLAWVINWAVDHLPRVKQADGDPVVGMIGESYSGALQLLGAAADPRIDAIVPFTTWYDIRHSLAPDRVPKTGWLNWLQRLSAVVNPFRSINWEETLYTTYSQASKGRVSDAVAEKWDDRSIKYHCENGLQWQADTLLVQGFRDVLFPINEAAKTYECLNNTGADVRLLGLQGGHLLPITQAAWMPGYHVEQVFYCDGQKFSTRDVVLAWFDAKLKGQTERVAQLPEICLTHSTTAGSSFPQIPTGGNSFQIRPLQVDIGRNEWLTQSLVWTKKLFDWVPLDRLQQPPAVTYEQQGGWLNPAFMPVMYAEDQKVLAGIPLAHLNLRVDSTDVHEEPLVFVGIGLREPNKQRPRLLSDQILPVRGRGEHIVEMPGVSTLLQPGAAIGLMVYTRSAQYVGQTTSDRLQVWVSGELDLPLASQLLAHKY